MKIKVGTRGSRLAVAQTNLVVEELKRVDSSLEIELIILKTSGDINRDTPLDKFSDKGIFVKEIEEKLLSGEIDFAVHSMKDMPSQETPGLCFANPPRMESPADVLICAQRLEELSQLTGMRIGTGSKRRIFQLEQLADVICMPIRGNIDTRIAKTESELDAVVLAQAGLSRLGYEDKISAVLDPKLFLPAPNQGILALQMRSDDERMKKLLSAISDERTTLIYETQRALQREVGATCHTPLGVYTEVEQNEIILHAMLANEDGTIIVRDEAKANIADRIKLACEMGRRLKESIANGF